jgi:hypothetical protein
MLQRRKTVGVLSYRFKRESHPVDHDVVVAAEFGKKLVDIE